MESLELLPGIELDPADWWAFNGHSNRPGTFIFKLHWVGSTIQFVGCTHLRTQFTFLRTELTVEAAEGLYCTGKMSVPAWTQPTHVGIQTDLGPLFLSFTGLVLHDSSIQFLVALGYRKCLLR